MTNNALSSGLILRLAHAMLLDGRPGNAAILADTAQAIGMKSEKILAIKAYALLLADEAQSASEAMAEWERDNREIGPASPLQILKAIIQQKSGDEEAARTILIRYSETVEKQMGGPHLPAAAA
ncbi:hypothetical protein [Aestuariispira insulae]|uniref:Tetratricopeptide repeat protein n=1 Tax=Aestuariispira insulae TaxID=1461337 RepID=A0A3D9H2J5_9PROT|nr:hypothetical protein [Aestuariispira insulae]RED43705.1 hypothetical protein DFP90_12116 [Aestuariispira insulae]